MRCARMSIVFVFLMLLVVPASLWANALRLATGSPYELGLVDALFDEFKKEISCDLKVTKAESGKSLALLKAGEVDVIMVHAPEEEAKAVEEGWALNRTYIGGNDFVIAGPDDDPVAIKGCDTILCAYRKIAEKKAPFYSRGDNSGTHKKEMKIWETTGVKPEGAWYHTTKDFMIASLLKANEGSGYFMTDRSTYIVAKKKFLDLKLVILFEGDPMLINRYHALTTNPTMYPQANYELAKKFVEFLKSEQGQKIIATFGKKEFGDPLYFSALRKPEK